MLSSKPSSAGASCGNLAGVRVRVRVRARVKASCGNLAGVRVRVRVRAKVTVCWTLEHRQWKQLHHPVGPLSEASGRK